MKINKKKRKMRKVNQKKRKKKVKKVTMAKKRVKTNNTLLISRTLINVYNLKTKKKVTKRMKRKKVGKRMRRMMTEQLILILARQFNS